MEYLGGIFFAMLFLQFGIREYQPAALLIPPYMVSSKPQELGELEGLHVSGARSACMWQ